MRFSRKLLTTLSLWAGGIGAAQMIASGIWVFLWSANTHSAVRGLMIFTVGVALVVVAGITALVCAQTSHILTANSIERVLSEAARAERSAPPPLRLVEPPAAGQSSHG